MNKGDFERFKSHVKTDHFRGGNEEQFSEHMRIISELLDEGLIMIDLAVLEKAFDKVQDAPVEISPEKVAVLTGMALRILEGELIRLNDEATEGEIEEEQTLDIDAAIIATAFKPPNEINESIKEICSEKGWEFIERKGLIIKIKKLKTVNMEPSQ